MLGRRDENMSRHPTPTEGPLVTKLPTLTAAAVAAVIALALIGCGAPSGGSGDDPAGAGPYTIDDLRGLIQDGDGLETLAFDPSEVTATAADDSEAISGFWEESGGAPAECYPIFASTYLLDDSLSGAGGDDDTMELGVFTEPADDDFGLVIVNGRIFDDADAAAGFLEFVADAASGCPDGYTLTEDGTLRWEVTGFDQGTFAGAPGGVESLTSEEQVVTEGAGLRATFLQRGNAVISFYAETYEGGTFTLDDVDPVIAAVAGRFAAL
jgi:hypothetical protein